MTVETPGKVVRENRDTSSDAGLTQLDISKLVVRLTDVPKPLPDIRAVPFGTKFSDHMAIASFHPDSGWSAPEIKPYAPLTIEPSASCFQYCTSVFEGLKAYLGPDGKARLFRPDMNVRRLERSMARLALPPVDGDVVLKLIKSLVQIDKRWIPVESGYSLYIRPNVLGTRPALGVTASDHALLYVITTPCGPYFQRPVSLLAATDAVRAWPGGTGCDKVGGNYSPGFVSQREAAAKGYDQVLWLFGPERRVTEAGAMNLFVVLRREEDDGLDVITPPLDGTILPGVTRASCLELAADPTFQTTLSLSLPPLSSTSAGVTLYPVERTFTMSDLERWSASGTLLEMFLVGTAAIVAAVQRIGYEGRSICVSNHTTTGTDLDSDANVDARGLGPVGGALRAKILAVQEGRDEYRGWGVVCEY